MIQEFSLAFAAGANRVEFYKLRNSADHPEIVEPFGLLRGDDSHRPVFDAYRTLTTYLSGFRSAQWERFGSVHVVTFDRGGETTTVLWNMGRTAARFTINAIAPRSTLVDEQGQTQALTAVDGTYSIDLPGAACTQRNDCFIGGAPRLLVEEGAPGERPGVIPLALLTPRIPDTVPDAGGGAGGDAGRDCGHANPGAVPDPGGGEVPDARGGTDHSRG